MLSPTIYWRDPFKYMRVRNISIKDINLFRNYKLKEYFNFISGIAVIWLALPYDRAGVNLLFRSCERTFLHAIASERLGLSGGTRVAPPTCSQWNIMPSQVAEPIIIPNFTRATVISGECWKASSENRLLSAFLLIWQQKQGFLQIISNNLCK